MTGMTFVPERKQVGVVFLMLSLLGAATFGEWSREAHRHRGLPMPGPSGNYQVLAFNDLGMHCYDKDFSVWSALPPFNVIHAQVVRKGSTPVLLDDSQVKVFYTPVADSTGSVNSTSAGKTNFWDFVYQLFGINLAVDGGILGADMPGSQRYAQPLGEYDPAYHWFTAAGIPITSIDDQGNYNQYPMMRILAYDKATGTLLAYTDIVLPVSDEMHCSSCHATGGTAADDSTAARYGISSWSQYANAERSYRENILILHDGAYGTNLKNSQPVLCASCHYSPALDLSGAGPQGPQTGLPMFSYAIHGRHGHTRDNQLPSDTDPAIIPEDGRTSCYSCHPGSETKCLRGAMGNAGINCQDCHGGLLAVSATHGGDRTPWLDEPKCQSCHTGDAVQNSGAIRFAQAYDPADRSAAPRLAVNKRFAEPDTQLFRFSNGHGNVACESCHGSTHAIWPTSQSNDNATAIMLQGHAGTIVECSTCHAASVPISTQGPHGMHPVNNASWISRHHDLYERQRAQCQACHGLDLEGTVLSRAAANRQFSVEDRRTVQFAKGEMIGCSRCHENPLHGG
jgi:hypothetical protein